MLASAGLLSEMVWDIAFPIHCGSSWIPLLIVGLRFGFVLGIGLSL